MGRRKYLKNKGFSLAELLVVMLITGFMLSGLISFFVRQQRVLKGQRLVADMQSLGFIGFFIIGRDIRSAGSNPTGMPTMNVFPVATDHEIRMVSDLNGDGVLEYWTVEEDWKVNLYGEYRFKMEPLDTLSMRFGVNNVLDGAPPLVDESLGYRPDYHSLKGREFYVQLRASF